MLRAAHDWLESAPEEADLLDALEAVEQNYSATDARQARIRLVCYADQFHGGPLAIGLGPTLNRISSREEALALLKGAAQPRHYSETVRSR